MGTGHPAMRVNKGKYKPVPWFPELNQGNKDANVDCKPQSLKLSRSIGDYNT